MVCESAKAGALVLEKPSSFRGRQLLAFATTTVIFWTLKNWLTSSASEANFPYRSLSLISLAIIAAILVKPLIVKEERWLLAGAGIVACLSCLASGNETIGIDALGLISVHGARRKSSVVVLLAAPLIILLFAIAMTRHGTVPLFGLLPFLLASLFDIHVLLPSSYRRYARMLGCLMLCATSIWMCYSNFRSGLAGGWLGTGYQNDGKEFEQIGREFGMPIVAACAALFCAAAVRLGTTDGHELKDSDLIGLSFMLAAAMSFVGGSAPFEPNGVVTTFILFLGAFALLPADNHRWKLHKISKWALGTIVLGLAGGYGAWWAGVYSAKRDLSASLRQRPPLVDVPLVLEKATLAMEDGSFKAHGGFDYPSLHRALRRDVLSLSYAEGGSTITQQAARYSFVGKQKTLFRKLRETWMTVAMESTLTKDQILSLYVDNADYGFGCIGVDKACARYFGITRRRLNLAEAIFLVCCVPKPPKTSSDLHRTLEMRKVAYNRISFWFPGEWADVALSRAATVPPVHLFSPPFIDRLRSLNTSNAQG